jgi:glutathione S-transferase
MTDLTLYGSIELSRSWWVAWICRELDIPFRNELTQIYTDPALKSPEYTSLNPNGLVPSIKDGEFVLWESMAINLYLAKKYGRGRLCPPNLEGESLAAQWSFWAVTRVEVPLLLIATSNRNIPPGSDMESYWLRHVPMWTPDEVARSHAVLNAPLAILNEKLSSSHYLLGSDFSVADLNVACILSRNAGAQIGFRDKPHLANWLRSCWSRPACPRKDALVAALDRVT